MRRVPGRQYLSRRDLLRLGLTGAASACLGPACQNSARTPDPSEPPGSEPVYELSRSDALYDDFDGHGNYQTFDGRDLAAAGALNPKLWVPGIGSRVIDSGGMRQNTLEVTCAGPGSGVVMLSSPPEITFADFRSLRADVMLSSKSTATRPYAVLNFHTTIPEQPPGRSWYLSLGIICGQDFGVFIYGLYGNVNLGLLQGDNLGAAAFDEWHALRLDIVTNKDDPALTDKELRIDYYVDGVLVASRIPEDSEILLDPTRTGLGPHRSLVLSKDASTGEAVGCFDNVRAVYQDRVG
jgi:hypothetical protein